ALSPSPPEQNRFESFNYDHNIKRKALIFDVIKIVLQLLYRVADGSAVRILDLRPARQSGSDQMTVIIIRDLYRELPDEMGPLGTRADKVHFAFQDVPKLRDFVDTRLADDLTHAGRAIIVRRCPYRFTIGFGIGSHRSEFYYMKDAAIHPDAFLLVEDRTARFKLDRDRSE